MNVALVLLLSSLGPLVWACLACRGSSIQHALIWALAAWAAWLADFAVNAASTGTPFLLYLALCLTGCAAIAVLGARRPHAAAWNFVVLSLLAVMLLPYLEGALLGSDTFDFLRMVLLAGTILMGIINYLPTRLGGAALMLALGCGGQLIRFQKGATEQLAVAAAVCIASVPWLALIGMMLPRRATRPVDATWRKFRDRFGLFWGLRVREQFNRAALHNSWPIQLSWFGVQGANDPAIDPELQTTMQALVQRFM